MKKYLRQLSRQIPIRIELLDFFPEIELEVIVASAAMVTTLDALALSKNPADAQAVTAR